MYERITKKVNTYIDERFEIYKGQISNDIAQGISALAGLIALWTVFLLFLVFTGILLGIVLWQLTDSLLLGFGIITLVNLLVGLVVFFKKKALIEDPVYRITRQALNSSKPND